MVKGTMKYWPNPVHKRETTEAGPGGWRADKALCPPMSIEERATLLDSSVANNPHDALSRRYAVRRTVHGLEFFEAKVTQTLGQAAEVVVFHGYPTRRVPARVLRQFRADGLVTDSEYRRLIRDFG